ncbi:MAG: glycosyltransferase family 2 protein [Candidatus Omnitrophica bacterium]|nr:glycosyltransferase family 2 protein [Candidatus Omnitrophota bacterium]
MKVEIDILNYEGADLLEKCVPSIIEAVKKSSHDCKIVVVDNCSTDNSEALVKNRFPEVRFYKAKENKVFCSLNEVAASSDADILLILNNDLVVDKNFIDPLINVFIGNDKVFLSSPKVYNFDGTDIEEGRSVPVLKWGVLKGIAKYKGFENDLDKSSYTLQAGFGAFDRKKLLVLNGYDTLYLPGILEDTDIAFRAWRRGYECRYIPLSVVYHMGSVSFNRRFGNKKRLAISHRNTYLFMWKNFRDKMTLFLNVVCIPLRMVYSVFTLKTEIVRGIFWAVWLLPEALKRRREEMAQKDTFARSDREIMALFKYHE